MGQRNRKLPQRIERASRFVLLQEAQHAVEHHDGQNGDRIGPFPHGPGDQGCRDQQPNDGRVELSEQKLPAWRRRHASQFVWPDRSQPRSGLVAAQATGRRPQERFDFAQTHCMKGGVASRSRLSAASVARLGIGQAARNSGVRARFWQWRFELANWASKGEAERVDMR